MTCPDCGSMTTVTKTDRFLPDAPTRRLRTCECGFRGTSVETWERRLSRPGSQGPTARQPPGNRPATGEPVRGPLKGGNSDLIRSFTPDSPGKVIRARAKSNRQAETDAFRAFYAEFPRKKKRPRAWRAWLTMGCETIAAQVMAGLRRQLRELRSRPADKVPYPASWLNDCEWEDPAQVTLQAVPLAVDDALSKGTDRKVAEYRDARERAATPEQLAALRASRG